MFISTNRLHNLFRADAQDIYQEFEELEIDGGLEKLLETGWTWNEFQAFIQGKVIWTSRHTYVALRSRQQYSIRGFHDVALSIDTSFWGNKLDVYAPTPAQAKDTLSMLMQLLAMSDIPHLKLSADFEVELPISTGALEYFLTQNESVQRLCFERVSLTEDHCRTLAESDGGNNRTIALCSCRLTDEGASLVKSIRESKGPSSLSLFRIGMSNENLLALADAVEATTCLRALELRDMRLTTEHVSKLAKALKVNVGLTSLDLGGNQVCDDNWEMLMDSARHHNTLEYLVLAVTWGSGYTAALMLSDEQKKKRTSAVLKMIESNKVLKGIELSTCEVDEKDMATINACLLINRSRQRAKALGKVDNAVRGFVLGETLGFVRLYPDLLWMFLSQNLDIVSM